MLGHRILWAALLLFLLLLARGRLADLRQALNRRTLIIFTASAALVAANWFIYIYALYSDQILQASLGYFINPILNVVLGLLFLGERLRPWQWLAVALATAAVGVLAGGAESFPWLSIGLAVSFGLYGLIRKTAPIDALLGTLLETIMLTPVALLLIARTSADGGVEPWTLLLLIASGAQTALPLLWFSNAARRMPLSVLGFFQYLAPTCQFLLAVFVYDEPFSQLQLISFGLIWAALIVFSYDAGRQRQRGAIGLRAAAR